MLVVKNSKSKDICTVYEVEFSKCDIYFLQYNEYYQCFQWFYTKNFKPYCKELFKIVKKKDKRIKANVYYVHRDHLEQDPTHYLIYKNKTWSWVSSDEYEIISPSEIN